MNALIILVYCWISNEDFVTKCLYIHVCYYMGFQGGVSVKNPPANSGDIRDKGSISGSGRSPRGGHGNPLQYSCLENPMDRGVWRATVHKVAKSWTRLKRPIDLAHTHRKETCEVRGSHVIFRNLFSTHTRYHLEELRVLWRTY